MEMTMKIIIICLFLTISRILIAGTTDPNIPDEEYLEYGLKFNSVVPIQVYIDGKPENIDPNFGSAVVINPRWAVTAAHVVKGHRKCFLVKDKKNYNIDIVISHKDFNEDNVGVADIAVVRTVEPIIISEYPELYSNDDELNKIASISGYGFTTKLKERVKSLDFDRKRRAGTNVIENIYSDILICSTSENDKNKSTLEFIICSGDSGGGLFIDGKLAGINSCVLATDGFPDSSYTDESGHTRISKFKGWILEKIQENNE